MSWRKSVDNSIRNHLELQIKGTHKHKESYSDALQPSNAQLWIAIANLSKQIQNLNSRLINLEKDLHDLETPPPKRKQKQAYELVESINQL